MANHPNRNTASRKLIKEWSGNITVGIYDNSTWRVRLYADRAVVTMPTVKWRGNTGGYHEDKYRLTGRWLADMLAIANAQTEDNEDYTDRVYDLLYEVDQYPRY